MKNILIYTFREDSHAQAVKWGLEKLGHMCEVLYSNALIDHHRTSLFLTNCDCALHYTRVEKAFSKYDAVWFRRYAKVTLPEALHPSDAKIAEQEWNYFQRSIRYLSEDLGRFVVNPPTEQSYAALKPVQLAMAAKLGFSIPPTLISNDPSEIEKFLKVYDRVIYKPFISPDWVTADGQALTATTCEIDSLTGMEDAVTFAPSIFQPYIDKAFEVRACFIGASVFAAKIDSQSDPESQFDWRQRRSYTRGILYPMELPEKVLSICRDYMEHMGLVTGSFDFIVTPGGDWVFLELNTGGQFLWLEFDIPEYALLDAFCHFLLSADPHFIYEPTTTPLSVTDFDTVWRGGNVHEPECVPVYEHPYVVEENDDGA